MSGIESICCACQARCKPFQPDNFVIMPMCPVCWGKLTVGERATLVMSARQAKGISDLVNLLHEAVRSGDYFKARRNENEKN